jgi:hypothetical protein
MSINNDKKSLGLSIGMHDEVFEAIRAIDSFRVRHPKSEIKIWGNKEAELEQVGSTLGMLVLPSPLYADKVMGLLRTKDLRDDAAAAAILREYLKFALSLYSQMNSEFVVFMHPDHLVLKRFRGFRLKHDLEIHKVNKYSDRQRNAWFEATGKDLELKSYGLAGYFRRESLVSALEFLLNPKRIDLELLMSRDLDFIFEDLIIPCAFDYLGFRIKDQNLTRELRRRRRLRSFFIRPVLLHQVSRLPSSHSFAATK